MVFVVKLEGKGPLERSRRRWKIILKCIFKEWDGAWIGLMWLAIGAVDRLL